MYWRAESVGQSKIPKETVFWTPDPPTHDELMEAGEAELPPIGCFHDSWRIVNATGTGAETYLREERQLADLIADLARDARHFDDLISTCEGGWVSAPDEGLSEPEREALGAFVWDVPPDLGGLELGVSGLSYALNAVGFVTASSCRGHLGSDAWSPVPVVALAARREGAITLQQLAVQVGCKFFVDEVRPELLCVAGRSIEDTMNLAAEILEHEDTFARASSS